MKRIKLTQGKVALVDDDDYERIAQHKWYAYKSYRTFYAVRKIRVKKKQIMVHMHRVVLQPLNNMEVDHIDGNGLNNQRENLRACTRSQNAQNQRPQIECSSKYKGVCWHKAAKKWQAQIRPKGSKRIYLGLFTDEAEAAEAYDEKALEFFGEFACTNFERVTV